MLPSRWEGGAILIPPSYTLSRLTEDGWSKTAHDCCRFFPPLCLKGRKVDRNTAFRTEDVRGQSHTVSVSSLAGVKVFFLRRYNEDSPSPRQSCACHMIVSAYGLCKRAVDWTLDPLRLSFALCLKNFPFFPPSPTLSLSLHCPYALVYF